MTLGRMTMSINDTRQNYNQQNDIRLNNNQHYDTGPIVKLILTGISLCSVSK